MCLCELPICVHFNWRAMMDPILVIPLLNVCMTLDVFYFLFLNYRGKRLVQYNLRGFVFFFTSIYPKSEYLPSVTYPKKNHSSFNYPSMRCDLKRMARRWSICVVFFYSVIEMTSSMIMRNSDDFFFSFFSTMN